MKPVGRRNPDNGRRRGRGRPGGNVYGANFITASMRSGANLI